MSGYDWRFLLACRPDVSQFVEQCDWSKLSGIEWAGLLAEQPRFAEHCDWDKLDAPGQQKPVEDYTYLEEQCPEEFEVNEGEFDEEDQSDGGEKNAGVPSEVVSQSDWVWLLKKQPQFAAHCDWSRLEGVDWASLLSERPEFAEHCDWSKLSEDELNVLQKHQPELVAASWRSASKPCQITERH